MVRSDAKPILETSKAVKGRVCAVEAVMETEDEAIDNCAVPFLIRPYHQSMTCLNVEFHRCCHF